MLKALFKRYNKKALAFSTPREGQGFLLFYAKIEESIFSMEEQPVNNID